MAEKTRQEQAKELMAGIEENYRWGKTEEWNLEELDELLNNIYDFLGDV